MEQFPDKDFNGYLEGITLADIIQLACLERYESKLEVKGEDFQGTIYFSGGEIVHAETGDLVGQEAFVEILCCKAGIFSFKPGKSERQTITISWNLLLMEATHQIDERNDVASDEKHEKLKVVVIDDSPIFSKALVKLFNRELGAKIVGKASSGVDALRYIELEKPDLVTLDINMPVMSGDVALKHIMIRAPAPVVLMSSFNERNFSLMMEYLCIGAVDMLEKPTDAHSWYIAKKRLSRLLSNISQFSLKNVRRSKKPQPVDKKMEVGEPARKLVLIIGGLGSLIELQKLLTSIRQTDMTAGLVFLDLYPEGVSYLVDYFSELTVCNPMNLESGKPLLNSQFGITYWNGSWEIREIDGAAVPVLKSDTGLLDTNRLLLSAANCFGDKVTVVVLSGTDLDMVTGLMEVAEKGGRVLLQVPDSCLFPEAIAKLEKLGLHDGYFTADDIDDLV